MAAAPPAAATCLPFSADVALTLHLLKERMERSERKAEGTLRLRLDAPSYLVAVDRLSFQDAPDGQLGCTAFDSRIDHGCVTNIQESYI